MGLFPEPRARLPLGRVGSTSWAPISSCVKLEGSRVCPPGELPALRSSVGRRCCIVPGDASPLRRDWCVSWVSMLFQSLQGTSASVEVHVCGCAYVHSAEVKGQPRYSPQAHSLFCLRQTFSLARSLAGPRTFRNQSLPTSHLRITGSAGQDHLSLQLSPSFP